MKHSVVRKDLAYYLSLHYPVVIHADSEGGFVAEIEELLGCMTQGETLEEVFEAIEDARHGWIQAAYYDGQDIPLPRDVEEYSGKILVRIPKNLHRVLAHAAKQEGVSLNQYIASLLAAGVQWELMKEREDFFEPEILRIAAGKPDFVVYDDFSKLRPSNTGDGYWLFRVKEILRRNGYMCHEARKRDDWGNCGYSGTKTHFHKPE